MTAKPKALLHFYTQMTLLPEFFISIPFSCNFILLIGEDVRHVLILCLCKVTQRNGFTQASFFGLVVLLVVLNVRLLSLQIEEDTNITAAAGTVIPAPGPTLELS